MHNNAKRYYCQALLFDIYGTNEPVQEILSRARPMFSRDTRPFASEIVDCSAFCEVIFYIPLKNLLGGFFYRLNDLNQRWL
jgi:hypothetical protein